MVLEATATQTIIREISADLETPISVYMKLRGQGPSFLLESVEGGERIARYSFIGVQPRAQYILRDGQIEINTVEETRTVQYAGDPTYFLQEEMNRYQSPVLPGTPFGPRAQRGETADQAGQCAPGASVNSQPDDCEAATRYLRVCSSCRSAIENIQLAS